MNAGRNSVVYFHGEETGNILQFLAKSEFRSNNVFI